MKECSTEDGVSGKADETRGSDETPELREAAMRSVEDETLVKRRARDETRTVCDALETFEVNLEWRLEDGSSVMTVGCLNEAREPVETPRLLGIPDDAETRGVTEELMTGLL